MSDRVPLSRSPAHRRWLFGPAVLDERTLTLAVNGSTVALERKPLEVLMFLLERPGEVVTRDELLAEVWPGRVTTEQVLTQCILKAREGLGDKDQSLINTVRGYGYRLAASVRVELDATVPPAPLDLRAGDHPPLRPLWTLVERLGGGGHGEAWLARHDKTREERVYKFALSESALGSLKREITLFRVLNESFGDKAAIVRILDWNLEHTPCFIECEHVAGGSLALFAEKAGGVANLPLALRLELAAQVAEATAAAHSVGVLHKDLKPSNVLIELPANGQPRAKLCDFGSGGILDRARLQKLGITGLGFTGVIDAQTSGTAMYAPPEVLAGLPPTTQSDVYALGVLLYQLAVGDLKRAPVPGWERGVADELLREDIAAACEGDANFRVIDAAELARRIRMLELRREIRAAEKPETKYVTLGTRDRVAYQVLGAGEHDLVFTTGAWGYMETQSAEPQAASFFRRLGASSRVIRFDRRGWGLSDAPRNPKKPLAERWIDDCLAVLDALGSRKPVFLVSGDGGPLVLEFVHRFPERCSGLIFFNSFACPIAKPDYPEGHRPEFLRGIANTVLQNWGKPANIALGIPSRTHDKAFVAWFAREQRLIARPTVVAENLELWFELDARARLASIRVPTLVMAREGFALLTPPQARYLADHIAGARFVSLPGSDVSLYWETPDTILNEIRQFMSGIGRDQPR